MVSSADKREKIESLQALRTIAFIGIFLYHAGSPVKWQTLGVSVFFVMSGFLMVYKHEDDELAQGIRERLLFSWERIRRLYPLHILTMIFAVILAVAVSIHAGFSFRSLFEIIGETALNIFLVQTWFPNGAVNVSLNGVAWYLSVTVFLYFMFPVILRFMKGKKQSTLWIICVIVLLVQWLSCVPFICYLGSNSLVYVWFMYCFPVFRLGDFFVGCVLGRQYVNSKPGECSPVTATVIELILAVITVMLYVHKSTGENDLIITALNNWTTRFIPVAAMWIYLFALNRGLITKAFTNRVFLFIGNLSAYMFLIHYVVAQYTKRLLNILNITLAGPVMWIVIVLEFVISLILSMMYKLHKSRQNANIIQ